MRRENRTGEKFINYQGCEFKIIEYITSRNCTIQFEDGSVYYEKDYGAIKKGKVKHLMFPTVCGVGYIGIGKYSTINDEKSRVRYERWVNMITRCYSNRQPTYKNVTVCEEWHNFQNFAQWFEDNYNYDFMQNWDLDKDLICPDCKMYSPETCAFIPKELNSIVKSMNRKLCEYNTLKIYKKDFAVKSLNGNIYKFPSKKDAFIFYKKDFKNKLETLLEKHKEQLDSRVISAVNSYLYNDFTFNTIKLAHNFDILLMNGVEVVLNRSNKVEYFDTTLCALNRYLELSLSECRDIKEIKEAVERVEKMIGSIKEKWV